MLICTKNIRVLHSFLLNETPPFDFSIIGLRNEVLLLAESIGILIRESRYIIFVSQVRNSKFFNYIVSLNSPEMILRRSKIGAKFLISYLSDMNHGVSYVSAPINSAAENILLLELIMLEEYFSKNKKDLSFLLGSKNEYKFSPLHSCPRIFFHLLFFVWFLTQANTIIFFFHNGTRLFIWWYTN